MYMLYIYIIDRNRLYNISESNKSEFDFVKVQISIQKLGCILPQTPGDNSMHSEVPLELQLAYTRPDTF